MRTASMVLGIIGSVFGIIAAIFAMLVGGIGHAFHASSSGEITGLGWGHCFCLLLASWGLSLYVTSRRLPAF
ncbi:hypothetical protein [Alicyclobacillus fastidiosus]|uniref:hypothetical protein n=1 Tax=Alicyclobacillus fastidiosus TaxID=392011 RepID=UPI0023E8FD21|nr:hypothetical protein [Alicyclobacillus fastidiosus]GMA64715.1 hypothetical protein GCM10025859_51550 [Alicyclobacillus fastidiosus]